MSALDLNDRTALITGAAGGIGQALARAFVGAGMRVALCDTAEDGLREGIRRLARAFSLTARRTPHVSPRAERPVLPGAR